MFLSTLSRGAWFQPPPKNRNMWLNLSKPCLNNFLVVSLSNFTRAWLKPHFFSENPLFLRLRDESSRVVPVTPRKGWPRSSSSRGSFYSTPRLVVAGSPTPNVQIRSKSGPPQKQRRSFGVSRRVSEGGARAAPGIRNQSSTCGPPHRRVHGQVFRLEGNLGRCVVCFLRRASCCGYQCLSFG